MRSANKAAHIVLHAFKGLLELDPSLSDEIGRSIPIPTFDEDLIVSVCDGAQKIFDRTDIVMDLRAPFYVIGDIHGNIFDLLRVLIHASPPPRSRFLFLGDYVDRGEYSIEVVTLLLSLVISFPEHVFLLRGNHEFESMNSTYGFSTEVTSQYPSERLYDVFNEVFRWMPLVAILNDQIFCVHGGICPHAKTVAQLRKIKRPLGSYDVDFVADLVWSDPCQDCKTFDESARGLGVQFGAKTLKEFLDLFKMKLMLRAHQCVQSGIARFGGNFGDLLYTIFSCSRYEGQANRCGLMFIDQHLQMELFSLPPFDQIPRAEAMLERVTPAAEHEMQMADSLALNVKLYDLAQSREEAQLQRNQSQLQQGKKDNLLQKFSRSPNGIPKRIVPLTRSSSCTSVKTSSSGLPPLRQAVSDD
jgi:protein phosphatase